MKTVRIALARGDGAAPEMMEQALPIVSKAACLDDIALKFVETPMGWGAFQQYGDTLPAESLRKATEIGMLYFGAVGDKKLDRTLGEQHKGMAPEPRCLLTIRKQWGLLLNFRPMLYYKALDHLARVRPEAIPDCGVEQHFIRFLLEDTYFGSRDLAEEVGADLCRRLGVFSSKDDVTGDEERVTDLAYFNRSTLEAYFRYAFEYAKLKKLPLICISKANVMSRYVLWVKVCKRIHAEAFPDVELRHLYVDAANELLFKPAELHGVIAAGNEHGDILSDGAASAKGGLGMMCSSAVNPVTGQAMFESGAGTASDISGQDKANPIGRILTGAMMLRHIGAPRGAEAIEQAVQAVLQEGHRTADIAKKGERVVGCREMGSLIMTKL